MAAGSPRSLSPPIFRPGHAALAAAALLMIGCQAGRVSTGHLTALYDNGRPDRALAVLPDISDSHYRNSDLPALDRSVLLLMSGRPDETVRSLETVRRRLDFYRQQDIAEQMHAMLSDDSAVAWAGREFERQMVDNIQILAAILSDSPDTQALATRGLAAAHQREQAAGPNPPSPAAPEPTVPDSDEATVPPVAPEAARMTAWLAAAVSSEHMHNADLTDRLIQQVASWQQPGESDSAFQKLGTQAARGSGLLQVVTFAGRVTSWEEEAVEPTTAALFIAESILSAVGEYSLPPTVSDVTIARPVHCSAALPFRTRVAAPTAPPALSSQLLDVNRAAWQSYLAERDRQIARAVVRRIVKKGTVYAAKNALHASRDSGTDILLSLAGMLWEGLEQTDLRYWTLLPASVEIAQMELPAGTHRITLQTVSASDPQAPPTHSRHITVDIEDGRNTFVVCFRPRDQFNAVHTSR